MTSLKYATGLPGLATLLFAGGIQGACLSDRSALRAALAALPPDSLCERECQVVLVDSTIYQTDRLPIGRPTMMAASTLEPTDLPRHEGMGPRIVIGRVPEAGWPADTMGAIIVHIKADSIGGGRALFGVIVLPPNGHYRTWFAALSRVDGRWVVDTTGRYYVP